MINKFWLIVNITLIIFLSGCSKEIDSIDYSLDQDEIFYQLDEIYKNPALEDDLPEKNFEYHLINKRAEIFSMRHSKYQNDNNALAVFYEEFYFNKRAELFGNNYPMQPYEMNAFVRLRESELGLAEYDFTLEGVVEERTYFEDDTSQGEYRIVTDSDEKVYFFTTNDDTVYKDASNYFYSNHIYFGGIPDPVNKRVIVHYDEMREVDEFNEVIVKALLIEQLSPND
jgi:hypothetical protein